MNAVWELFISLADKPKKNVPLLKVAVVYSKKSGRALVHFKKVYYVGLRYVLRSARRTLHENTPGSARFMNHLGISERRIHIPVSPVAKPSVQ